MRLIEPPARLSSADYSSALSLYVSKVGSLPSVRTVATMGSVKAPGLSDLDVIVVGDNTITRDESLCLSVETLDPRIFIHGPIVIPVSLVDHLQWLVFASNVSPVYGDDVIPSYSDIPHATASHLATCYLIDFCEMRLVQFATARLNGFLKMRQWHPRIWSINHSLDLAERYLAPSIAGRFTNTIEIVRMPRCLWQEGREIPDNVFLDAFHAAEDLNLQLFEFALESQYSSAESLNVSSLLIPPKRFFFDASVSRPRYQGREMTILGKHFSLWWCYHHPSYRIHLGSYLSSATADESECTVRDRGFVQTVRKRAMTVYKHQIWLNDQAQHVDSLSGYLGFPLRGPRTMKSLIKELIDSTLLRLLKPASPLGEQQ